VTRTSETIRAAASIDIHICRLPLYPEPRRFLPVITEADLFRGYNVHRAALSAAANEVTAAPLPLFQPCAPGGVLHP
jgi:hypothetical protein